MKNLLFISSYPFPLDKGSNLHAYFFLKALCVHFHVHGIFFTQPGHDLPDDIDRPLASLDMVNYDICRFSRSPRRGRISASLCRLYAFPGSYMNLAVNPANLAKIKAVIGQNAIDVVHIEHFHYAKYTSCIPAELKKVIVYHDLYHTLYSQKAVFEKNRVKKLLLWLDCWKFYLFERRLDWAVDFKIFLNAEEMRFLPRKAVHIPHVANPAIKFRKPRQTDRLNILFIGAYKHPPNVMSVELIIDRILPLLARQTNRFTIHLIGSGMDQFKAQVDRSPLKRFVVIRGFIADINDAFKDMDIALFPICYGGGVKTKILDAMSAGVPIVTTPEGLIGLTNINGDSIAQGKTPADLVVQLTRLMDDCQLRHSMAQSAKTYVDQQNSYRIFADRIKAVYGCL